MVLKVFVLTVFLCKSCFGVSKAVFGDSLCFRFTLSRQVFDALAGVMNSFF